MGNVFKKSVPDLLIDKIDMGIIELLEGNSSLTHSSIAEELDRSQPAIGARIKKLQTEGLLGLQYGIDFSKANRLILVKVEMAAKNPNKLLELAQKSPNIINVLKLSGTRNIMVFIACSSMKRIDYLVDQYFRSQKEIDQVQIEIITDFGRPFILPVNFNVEKFTEPDEPIKESIKTPVEIKKK